MNWSFRELKANGNLIVDINFLMAQKSYDQNFHIVFYNTNLSQYDSWAF